MYGRADDGDAELALERAKHPGPRLATLAAGLRKMRAVIDAGELAARRAHALAHVLVNLRERCLVVKPAPDARLIRDDGDAPARRA